MTYFAYPFQWLWLLVPAALMIAAWFEYRRRRQAFLVLGKPETIQRLLPEFLARRRRWILSLRWMALMCFAAALAGPLLGAKLVEFKQKGLDVFIAVDCSLSMQAEDFKPNRMAHAKLLLGQLIDSLPGSRIGVLAFAGDAFVRCPLTIDTSAAKQTLDDIDVGSVPLPGTAIGRAIELASKGLQVGEGVSRVLVLLTDGEDHKSNPVEVAKKAHKSGLQIFTVGIGSPQGEPIPVFDEQGKRTGYKRDKKGDVVISKTDEQLLMDVAREGQGEYFRASSSGEEIESLVKAVQALEQGEQKGKAFNRFENRYQWPLALGVILLLVSLMIPEKKWK